ncbi:hypothetical protein A2U01_0060958, partial [Trifolium medium]|nr:hypothetical protein [Trifolium medium]
AALSAGRNYPWREAQLAWRVTCWSLPWAHGAPMPARGAIACYASGVEVGFRVSEANIQARVIIEFSWANTRVEY